MQSDRSFPAFFYSPPLPRTVMLRLHGSPFDREYLRGATPGAPACRREWPVPSERILHREFCHDGPIGDPRRLVKLGTEKRVGDGHRTDRTGPSHYRRSRSLPMWTWTMGEGPLLYDKPNRTDKAGVLQRWACTLSWCWSLVILEKDEAKTSSCMIVLVLYHSN